MGGLIRAGFPGPLPPHAFGAAAIVLKVAEQRVFEEATGTKLRDEAADAAVHGRDHGSIDLHVAAVPCFMGGAVFALWCRGECRVSRGDNAELVHAFVACSADGIVTCVVAAALRGDVFLAGVHGPMGGREGYIEKEWLVGVLRGMILQKTDRMICDGVGVIVWLRWLVGGVAERRDGCVVARQEGRIPEAAAADDGAVETVESPLQWPIAAVVGGFSPESPGNVPLSGHAGAVAAFPEGFRDGHTLAVEIAPVSIVAAVVGHVANARLMRIEACEQAGPGWAAAGRIVELSEAQTTRRELVQLGRRDLPPVASEVGESHVIAQNDDDSGAATRVACSEQGGSDQAEKAGHGTRYLAGRHRQRKCGNAESPVACLRSG